MGAKADRRCEWCDGLMPEGAHHNARYCSAECRREVKRERDRKYREDHREERAAWRAGRRDETREYNRKYREEHREERRQYRQAHREEFLAQERQYREANRDKVRASSRRYYETHREEVLAKGRLYRLEHREHELERSRRYRAAHAAQVAENARRYRQENRDRRTAYNRQYREAHRDKVRESKRLYWAAHPNELRLQKMRRRARVRETEHVPFTAEEQAARLALFGGRCWLCGGDADHWDHIIPLAPRPGEPKGADRLDNLVPMCANGNLSKHTRPLPYWLPRRMADLLDIPTKQARAELDTLVTAATGRPAAETWDLFYAEEPDYAAITDAVLMLAAVLGTRPAEELAA